MRILGIDPGLTITGYGLLEAQDRNVSLIEGGVIRTEAGEPLAVRLAAIHEGIAQVIAEGRPDVMVVEELYSKYAHPKTAILMGHARGVICLAAAAEGVPVENYTASQVKKSVTGNGNASKLQMQRTICHLLKLQGPPKPADVADALAVALCHANPRGRWHLPGPRRAADRSRAFR